MTLCAKCGNPVGGVEGVHTFKFQSLAPDAPPPSHSVLCHGCANKKSLSEFRDGVVALADGVDPIRSISDRAVTDLLRLRRP